MADIKKVVSYFKKVCSIPRASGDEKAVSDYVAEFARGRGLEVTQDKYFNLLVKKPATVKNAGAPVILQGHLDMVYVKARDDSHVYEEGIDVKEDEDFFFAEGTSLGADNGIAIAYCLALMESKEIPHSDLEFLFTVQEEVGLVGADVIDLSSLKGTQLINLDSEEEGIFYTSCAGGVRCRMLWNLEEEKLKEERVPLVVTFASLEGGHSGINIGMGLGNSIVLMGRLLHSMKDMDVRMSRLDMQGKANAIANGGSVCLHVRAEDIGSVKCKIKQMEQVFCQELQFTDSVSIQMEENVSEQGSRVYARNYQRRIVDTLVLMPYGVAGYSFAIDGLVETSMNLGALTEDNGTITLLAFIRSSVESQKYVLRDKVNIIAGQNCDGCIFENDYPGWKYRKQSVMRDTSIAVYEQLFHKKAEVAAIHAGLECGYLDKKIPGVDIISMGPNLFDVHSAKEKMEKQSMINMWVYLLELLKKLAEK